jgi:hypothetical protein
MTNRKGKSLTPVTKNPQVEAITTGGGLKKCSNSVKHRPCYKGAKCQTTEQFNKYLCTQNPLAGKSNHVCVESHLRNHEEMVGDDPQKLTSEFMLMLIRGK